jgi:hypothetical protein
MSPTNVRTIRDSGSASPPQESSPGSDAAMPCAVPVSPPPGSAEESRMAFERDLPRLLRQYPGRWVAYHQSKLVEVGRDQAIVYQHCLDLGFDEEEFVVLYVDCFRDAPNRAGRSE